MVDNFDIIRKILRFDNDGECYYVQLLRRAADDPKPDGKPDPAYHGNMHSRSVKDYFIHSLEHLDRVEEEIKELCRMFNVRAYIRLNRRSFKKIALQMLKHIAEQVSSGESYSSPHHMISSAAGMVHDEPNKTWLVDLDSEYLPYEQDIKNIICECEPIWTLIADAACTRETFLDEHTWTIPTKSGKHIIVQPFNRKEFSDKWSSAGLAHLIPCDIHKDNPTILFVP
jgi:hypothetical protein